ncbi:hypothetical protein [Nocardioides sp. InS609-2]|nr:hypothetical protein [Nocardioides sp. InS609-2]MBA3782072.1 hypothetical protein [Nocardioides sp.]
MSTQLHEAYGIVRARANSRDDHALLRTVELARTQDRRLILALRIFGR